MGDTYSLNYYFACTWSLFSSASTSLPFFLFPVQNIVHLILLFLSSFSFSFSYAFEVDYRSQNVTFCCMYNSATSYGILSQTFAAGATLANVPQTLFQAPDAPNTAAYKSQAIQSYNPPALQQLTLPFAQNLALHMRHFQLSLPELPSFCTFPTAAAAQPHAHPHGTSRATQLCWSRRLAHYCRCVHLCGVPVHGSFQGHSTQHHKSCICSRLARLAGSGPIGWCSLPQLAPQSLGHHICCLRHFCSASSVFDVFGNQCHCR